MSRHFLAPRRAISPRLAISTSSNTVPPGWRRMAVERGGRGLQAVRDVLEQNVGQLSRCIVRHWTRSARGPATRRPNRHRRAMQRLRSSVDPRSVTFAANREVMERALAELQEQVDKALGGGGQKYVQRHRARGRLLPRERIDLLVDLGSPLVELSPVAAAGTSFPVGASVVTAVGVVEGVECVLIASDPTVRGGAINLFSINKILRAMDIARENRLPLLFLVESGGADLPSQGDFYLRGGNQYRHLTQMSAMGVPSVALVFGNATAGGAYVPGMCDYTILIKQQSKVFLGGPPLVKMATGEESDDETLGGSEMHARESGLCDYLAVDEYDCIRIARQIIAHLGWRKLGPPPGPVAEPLENPEELLGIASGDPK